MALVFKATVVELDGRVLLDFRLSKGDGIEFKKRLGFSGSVKSVKMFFFFNTSEKDTGIFYSVTYVCIFNF
jgi:hypothetical protein